ncbi:DUF1566 domain-containing protein [Myxococcota bacterium]
MPNPPGTGLPNPASYADLGNGIVRDQVTCLEWEKSPSSSKFNNRAAISHCQSLSLGGHSDWRAPTRIEMTSIMDWTRNPATDAVFSAASGFHKTGSNWILTIERKGAGTTCGNGDCAWAFNMGDGMVSNAKSAADSDAVRCVRGNGVGEGFDDPAQPPPNHYTALSDDDVRDNYTRLVWQRNGKPLGDQMVSWQEAVSYCDDLTLGGQASWRLPSIRELATLVNEARVAQAINEEMFPNTQGKARSNNWYWASHQARNSSAAWGINFDDGFTGFNSGSAAWNTFGPSWVKCVRDENE